MQLQITQHEQAHISRNKQQTEIQQTQSCHNQAKQVPAHRPGKLKRRQSTSGPQCAMPRIGQNFLFIYNTQAKIMLNKFN